MVQMPSAVAVAAFPEIVGLRCWEWIGYRQPCRSSEINGYGQIKIDGITQLTHRVAWYLETGKYPEPQGLHKCDNPACVRFLHLFEGTVADNAKDKAAKGRVNRMQGSKHGRAKVNTKSVIEIRKRHRNTH
jgi:HNH endonuclease